MKVLVIDDHVLIREALRGVLKELLAVHKGLAKAHATP